jgi:hypothetical protein
MNKVIPRVLVVLVIAAGFDARVDAKGPTVRLTITGPGLLQPLDVTDPDALVHVWSAGFIGAVTVAPAASLPRYLVSFHVQPPRSNVKVMYAVRYVVDPQTRAGFVYLPGRGEEGYRLNVSTILRETDDGRWHHAPAAWSQAISSRLTSATTITKTNAL